MNWCKAPSGSRCSASAADVTVPEVTSTAKSCARSRSISGTTASISPTLAPCTQISGPLGRGRRRFAAALGEPLRMLLAALEPPRQQLRRHRRAGGGCQLIEAQRERHATRPRSSSAARLIDELIGAPRRRIEPLLEETARRFERRVVGVGAAR